VQTTNTGAPKDPRALLAHYFEIDADGRYFTSWAPKNGHHFDTWRRATDEEIKSVQFIDPSSHRKQMAPGLAAWANKMHVFGKKLKAGDILDAKGAAALLFRYRLWSVPGLRVSDPLVRSFARSSACVFVVCRGRDWRLVPRSGPGDQTQRGQNPLRRLRPQIRYGIDMDGRDQSIAL
jgi:hypothetical protein